MINEIRQTVKKLFNEKKIDVLIGYGEGTLPLRTTPCFITTANGTDKLVWNSSCTNNLAVYLPRFFAPQPREKEPTWPRVGIIANGCTGRSVVGLLKEKQVPRENIVIVGVPCDGMIDIKKIQDGEKKQDIDTKKLMAKVCESCECPTPAIHDILIKGKEKKPSSPYQGVEEFEKMSRQERWFFFEEQVSKCIRCYACRAACPNCWCKECFVDHSLPRWVGITNDISDIMFYHIGRIFHQAGRCVDCGACVAACPVGIDLRKFTYKLVKDAKDLYGYEAGISLEEPPPLATYNPDDEQEFMTEP